MLVEERYSEYVSGPVRIVSPGFYVGYTDAPESSHGFTVETKGLFGGLVYDVDTRTAIPASVAYERRPRFYDRTLISFGSSIKF